MYHSNPNLAPEVFIPGRTPQQQAAHDKNKSDAMDAIVHVLWWMWAAGPLAASAKAGFNWHELTGDAGASVERGAQALVRWKWFQFATFAGAFCLLGGWTSVPGWMTFLNVTLWWCLALWLVVYVRLAEFSLFRRGPIQWVVTPLAKVLDGVHTWALVVAALLPVPAFAYLAMTV